ncbi:hypothetical protein [Collimonas humicola]|uniref:hypothetical protein n=1 Tax=Collimonas humicola TaxID=2825886 RepID=UPI001B8D1B05|nr:hypothetical protein [Collimonas humicola]
MTYCASNFKHQGYLFIDYDFRFSSIGVKFIKKSSNLPIPFSQLVKKYVMITFSVSALKTKLGILTVLVIASLSSGCKEQIPPTDTDPYNRLHGIINDGKTTNEITLVNESNTNRPTLRFPSAIRVDVDTSGAHDSHPVPIRTGIANEASIDLAVDTEHKLVPYVKKHFDSIQIRFSASVGPAEADWVAARLREIEKRSIKTVDKSEWGLREYDIGDPKTGTVWRYEYVPLDESFRSFDGTRIWFSCNGGGGRPDHCMNRFDFSDGLSIVYIYEPDLLAYWRQIHQEVLKFVDSSLVK